MFDEEYPLIQTSPPSPNYVYHLPIRMQILICITLLDVRSPGWDPLKSAEHSALH